MCSKISYRRKQIMLAVCISVLVQVTGECPFKCYCSRHKTFCSLARLYTLPTQLPSTMETVVIEGDYIPRINRKIIANSGLHNLTFLGLINVHLQKIQPRSFQTMNQLEKIIIRLNTITTLRSNTFKYLERLYILDLSFNGIIHLESGTFSGLGNLRYLVIDSNYIKHFQANAFEGMKYVDNCSMIDVPVIKKLLFANNIEPEIAKYLCTFTYFYVGYSEYRYNPPHLSSGFTIIPDTIIPGFIFNNIHCETSGLLYLDLSIAGLQTLDSEYFQNLKKLIYLDLTGNNISYIQPGAFENLPAVKTLKLNYNNIESLKNRSFHGLVSLQRLEMIECGIKIIESDVFRGLPKLQILDLSRNKLQVLETNAFSCKMLKEIKLEYNILHKIDSNAFSGLRYLKSLSSTVIFQHITVNKFEIKYRDVVQVRITTSIAFRLESNSDLQLFNTDPETFINMNRIDTFDIIAKVSLPKGFQVLKTMNLYIDARQINSCQDFSSMLLTTRYVKNMTLALVGVNSTEILSKFSDPQISRLTLLYSDLKIFNKNNLIGFSTLKSFIIHGYNTYSIQEGAFNNMLLTDLTLHYALNLTFKQGAFHGLNRLKNLYIFLHRYKYELHENTPHKCIDAGVFLGLDNLERLVLTHNFFTCVKLGAFQGLYNIKRIYLNDNHIQEITAGVFGALCNQKFKMSCKNVTSPDYCNKTNALTSLKFLDLSSNNISYIHPQAFISCTNLQTLDLSNNAFLTLGEPFLYTPSLRFLYLKDCGICEIPNNTFSCSPLLYEINLSGNSEVNKLTVDTLFPLKKLDHIDISYTNLLCDCDLYETWLWFRRKNVQYLFAGITSDNTSFCGDRNIEKLLSSINCNTSTKTSMNRSLSKSIINDFAFFKQYIEPTILIIIFIFGLTFNGFLLFISLYNSDMRTKENASVIHLAVVDILSLIVNLPLSYFDVVNVRWEFDDITCKIFILTKDIIVSANVFSVIALSVERFLVARSFNTLKKVCISKTLPRAWLLMMTWISAIVMSLPAYFSATVEIRCLYCPPHNEDYIKNVWTFHLIMYCLMPSGVLIFLNIKTSLFLRESIRKIPGKMKDNIRTRNRKMVANIVLILTLVFIISNLPNFILRVLVAWSIVDIENIFLISFITFCLFFFNAVFNPISLFIMSSKYKCYALSYYPF